jgi:hypothetical protein
MPPKEWLYAKTYKTIQKSTFKDIGNNKNIYIKNIYKNYKKLSIMKNQENFFKMIIDDLNNGKNLFIVCLSATESKELYDNITEKCKNIKVSRAYGDMDDVEKKSMFIDVNNVWA